MNPVEPILGEPLRFRVASRSGRAGVGSYLVDLSELDFNGACGCDAFHFTFRPALDNYGQECGEETRCWHIKTAREWLLDKLLRDIAAVRGGAEAERRQERSGA